MDQGAESNLWSLGELVRRAGLISENQRIEVEAFTGGVSCIVVLVRTKQEAWVVKQALPQLRVKDLWLADRNRIFAEVACLRLIHDRISGHPAPTVFYEDGEDFACVLEYAGDGSRNWKQDLLSGVVDSTVTRRVASVLTEFHSKTQGDEGVKKRFWDNTNFHQLRLDAYLTTTAIRHPALKPQLDEVSSFLAEERICLVHGDFSPKNILLLPDGRLWVIDCEVAHYGNPVFDIAFCTNHLILKSIHLDSLPHLEEARSLWSTYWSEMRFAHLEGEAVRALTALMLARIDGKSPVEYLTEQERRAVRSISQSLIGARDESFATLTGLVSDRIRTGRGR
jgi:aminoglycoside phosphotransferase (APT) family kinase protein